MVVILTAASGYSQNTLPLQTKHNGENAVIISEAHMDSINITYMKYRVFKSYKSILDTEVKKCKAQLDAFMITINSLEDSKTMFSSMVENKDQEIKLLTQKHKLEVQFYKKRSKGKWVPFAIGFVAGAVSLMVF